jgi:hypothetical protein
MQTGLFGELGRGDRNTICHRLVKPKAIAE